ncbi:MAG: hypothetical protein KQH79_07555 [Bacteroidetes bacterium]|nr:hypothetical protein [Bacteroidota bacterium]
MSNKKIYIGDTLLHSGQKEVKGQFVEIEGEKYYKISNYDQMQDFFISVVSNSDHWMFISSNGSLSAGRKNRDHALFPYYTVDKIHDYKGITGSSSCFIIQMEDKNYLWEPFTETSHKLYAVKRNIYKSFFGNQLIFEEINQDLNVTFLYSWCNSEKFGFIKKSKLINNDSEKKVIQVLDGIQNILPAGIDYNFQNEFSNLLDAYKKNELMADTQLGLFTLSSVPVDRAEPSESLYATTVWNAGLHNAKVLISGNQIDSFKKGIDIDTELDIRARRGAYFVNSALQLKAGEEKDWMLVAEINQDNAAVSDLNQFLLETKNLENIVEEDIKAGTESLRKIASVADGMQVTNTPLCYARHYSNTLYNAMRGGVFVNNYTIDTQDFKAYLSQINKLIYTDFQLWLNDLPAKISSTELIQLAEKTKNTDLLRITYEYLPLTFSRRHGDPSRPWNLFSIETKNDDGSVKYNYEGNWRDIFQNWEALAYSFPEFVEGMISKFVNTSTADGYNPYRVMRNGMDWESPDPDDPWAYIGYWGDHQIIYLQKLLEVSNNFHPGKLDELLVKEIFTYANVPYQIKPHKEIIENPKDTIVFNHKLNKQIVAMEELVGADAKLLKNWDVDKAYKANLMEKVLVTLLSKLSNFVPEAGIWLNTQRPEWNDANNALVGNGTSMVTLYYLRRFLTFWQNKLTNTSITEFQITHEVASLFEDIFKTFKDYLRTLDKGFIDTDRKQITDMLGMAHSDYRETIYKKSFNGRKRKISLNDLVEFIAISLEYIDQSIQANKREDGLYHAYNLISISRDEITIRHLYEMLEGQVAVLSSGYLSTEENLHVLDALKNSKMFRSDQYSYMLYPDRELPKFIEKNIIPAKKVKESKLLTTLLDDENPLIVKVNKTGKYYFNSEFRNADILEQALDKLDKKYSSLLEEEKDQILNIYEEIFDHQSFTGRSGTFYGYEGLGSIYWHMVSKLLLATQECYFKAVDEGADENILGRLKEHYYEIKAGIGLYKSPDLYGAFPTDAYSHTPGKSGVKQPGLTGQVKEDVISRLGELGIRIKNGEILFDTSLLNHKEILSDQADFEFYTMDGNLRRISLEQKQLALTFCQVPIVYTDAKEDHIIITFTNHEQITIPGNTLTKEISEQIFKRNGEIKQLDVLKNNLNGN